MAGRKGGRTARHNEREFPNIVELPVPPGGFGAALNVIHAFHTGRGLEPRPGRWRWSEGQDFVRWCFADRADADAFEAAFGGVVLPTSRGQADFRH